MERCKTLNTLFLSWVSGTENGTIEPFGVFLDCG